jgi:protein-S-isoprenylcysteine O-methyltransferase Ste14
MPLSEHEQRLLDQMEQALYAEDPRFATHMQGVARRSHTRHVLGAVGALAGLGLVIVGINTTWIVGGIGFLLMVAALAVAFTPPRQVQAVAAATAERVRGQSTARGGRRASRSGTFMQRMEDRWDRRRGQW